MRVLASVLLLLLSPMAAWALGPVVGPGCLAEWDAVTLDKNGAPITTGVVSYKVYLSKTAITGGPVLPPAGATIIFAAGLSASICPGLIAGEQYSYWTAALDTPPPPGAVVEGAPSPAVPFQMTPPPPAQTPAAPANARIK